MTTPPRPTAGTTPRTYRDHPQIVAGYSKQYGGYGWKIRGLVIKNASHLAVYAMATAGQVSKAVASAPGGIYVPPLNQQTFAIPEQDYITITVDTNPDGTSASAQLNEDIQIEVTDAHYNTSALVPISAQGAGGVPAQNMNVTNLPGVVSSTGTSSTLDVKTGIADTTMQGGAVTAPASGAAIATLPGAATAGIYELVVTTGLGGAAAVAADVANLSLQKNGVGICQLAQPGVGEGGPWTFRLTLAATDILRVVAGGNAGTAGVVYTATLTLKKVG